MQTRISALAPILAGCAAALLAACGGGSSGTGAASTSAQSSVPGSAPASSFPLGTALATVSANGLSANLKLSGTYQGASVSGTGSFIESAADNASFEGQPALRQTITLSTVLSLA